VGNRSPAFFVLYNSRKGGGVMKKREFHAGNFILLILSVLLVAVLVILFLLARGNGDGKEEGRGNSTDYFNGEIVKITEEDLWVKPMEGWKWKETEKVKIPLMQTRGDDESLQIPLKLHNGEISDLRPGDQVRVAFHAGRMIWTEEDVLLEVVFMLYRLEDIKKADDGA